MLTVLYLSLTKTFEVCNNVEIYKWKQFLNISNYNARKNIMYISTVSKCWTVVSWVYDRPVILNKKCTLYNNVNKLTLNKTNNFWLFNHNGCCWIHSLTLALSIPNPTFSLQHRQRSKLATLVIATFPSWNSSKQI